MQRRAYSAAPHTHTPHMHMQHSDSPQLTGGDRGRRRDSQRRPRARPNHCAGARLSRSRVLGELLPIVMCIASCDMFRNRHVPSSPTRCHVTRWWTRSSVTSSCRMLHHACLMYLSVSCAMAHAHPACTHCSHSPWPEHNHTCGELELRPTLGVM